MTATVAADRAGECGTEDAEEALATTRDSISVAVWTALSRVTGLIRVMVIAAVLGPTFLGNTYQFTNSVPNLVYYGLLGGALISSLIVPPLVRHLSHGEKAEAELLARGVVGCAVAAGAVAVPVIMIAVPLALRATSGGSAVQMHAQVSAATWLVLLLSPQIVCYAVIACSVAVMNAHRRFALAAAAPLIENLGSIAVLALVWAHYGSGREVTHVGGGEIVLLGIGTTAAVGLHAAVQWLGARRCGIALLPRAGWRDPAVRTVAARSGMAVGQAGLWAIQVIIALALANRLAGGVVAVLIATNFFFLPIALGATPIALAALPRMATHHVRGERAAFEAVIARALSLTVFVTAPAAVGYVVLARGLAHSLTFGSASAHNGPEMVTLALVALAPGVIGTSIFTVATYAFYAQGNAVTPVRSMFVQSLVAIPVMLCSLALSGDRALLLVTGGLAVGGLVGAALQLRRLGLPAAHSVELGRAALRTEVGLLVMAPAAWGCHHLLARHLPSHAGELLALGAGVVAGALAYLLTQRAVRSPELALVTGSFLRRRRMDGESS